MSDKKKREGASLASTMDGKRCREEEEVLSHRFASISRAPRGKGKGGDFFANREGGNGPRQGKGKEYAGTFLSAVCGGRYSPLYLHELAKPRAGEDDGAGKNT